MNPFKAIVSFLCYVAVSAAVSPIPALAQAVTACDSMCDTVEVSIRFKVSHTDIDRNFKLNDESLANLKKQFEVISSNNGFNLTGIRLESAASPEGPMNLNAELSRKRAESVVAAIKGIDPSISDDIFVIISRGEDWEGALKFIEQSDMPFKEQAIEIMTNVPLKVIRDGKWVDGRKKQMMQLHGGSVWRYIVSEYFPELRKTDVIIAFKALRREFEKIAVLETAFAEYKLATPPSGLKYAKSKTAPEPEHGLYTIGLKTNMLYDAVTVLNASIEIPIGKNFSLEFSDIFPWWAWGKNDNKYALQLWSMGPEFRWWFARTDKRDVLSGHFIGLNVHTGKYDVQRDFDLCYRGSFWTTGLSYGYSLPISKHFNMEFSATVGYVHARYQHYEPGQDYEHLFIDRYNAGKLSYFGPTGARVTLIWPIDIRYRKH